MLAEILYKLSLALGYKEQNWTGFPKQESQETISWSSAKEITENTTGIGIVTYHNSDAYYKFVDIEHLKNFMEVNPVSKRTYVPEEHDCDDFSYELMGDVSKWDPALAFGIIWGITPSGNSHVWNWCVGLDKKIWFIEPQTDKVFLPDEYWKTTWIML